MMGLTIKVEESTWGKLEVLGDFLVVFLNLAVGKGRWNGRFPVTMGRSHSKPEWLA